MHILAPRQQLIDDLIDLVSIKGGLILTESKAFELLSDISPDWWTGDGGEFVRIEALEMENPFLHLMYKVGAIDDERHPLTLVNDFVIQNADLLKISLGSRMEVYKAAMRVTNNIFRCCPR